MLRPANWIADSHLSVGVVVNASLPEMDLTHVTAVVTAIEHAPSLAAGEGSMVIGRFVTRNVKTLAKATFEGGVELTGTEKHPVWSEDREAFIELADLKPGERVRTRDGITILLILRYPAINL